MILTIVSILSGVALEDVGNDVCSVVFVRERGREHQNKLLVA